MTTEAGRRLLALIDDDTDECVWMDAAVRAIEAEARAALLAELRRGVEGLRDELAARGQPQRPEWYVRVLDLIEEAGEP